MKERVDQIFPFKRGGILAGSAAKGMLIEVRSGALELNCSKFQREPYVTGQESSLMNSGGSKVVTRVNPRPFQDGDFVFLSLVIFRWERELLGEKEFIFNWEG